MTATTIWLCIAVILTALLALSYFFTRKPKQKKEESVRARPRPAEAPVQAGGARRRRNRMNQSRANQDLLNDSGDDRDDDGGIAARMEDEDGKKIGAKKQRKLEMKAEKKEAREAELEEREERKRQEALLAAERLKEDEARLKLEKEREELERERKEEQERKEHEEYLKMKAEFTIEESGEVGVLSEEESQSLLREFVDYMRQQKVVLLEELAAHFDMKVQDTIARVEELQEMGWLTGVMDDRGKFIYISQEELEAVAKFIKQRGRVSIADLAESSNVLVNMTHQEVVKESDDSIQVTGEVTGTPLEPVA